MGHEVVLFQILSRDEIELPYRRDLEFADLESGRTLAINAGLARREYKDAMAAFLERWHSRAGAEGFQYSLIVTDTPPERALRNFLLARPKVVQRAMLWLNPRRAVRARGGRRADPDPHPDPAARGALSVSDAAVPAADAAGGDPPSPARGSAAARGPRRGARRGGRRAGRPAAGHRGAAAGVGSPHRPRIVVDRRATRRLPSDGASSTTPRISNDASTRPRSPTASAARRSGSTTAPPARREIVIASPFPIGSITQADIAAIPPSIGVRFERTRHAAGDADRRRPAGC